MWFGTDAGLSRFDGKNFLNFSLKDGLTDNIITKIFEDSKHRLWVLSPSGSPCYYQDAKFFSPGNDSLLREAVCEAALYSIAEDDQSNIWISSVNRSLVCIKSDGKIAKYEVPVSTEDPVFIDFYFTSDNEFWIISQSRFFKFENNEFIPLVGPGIKAGNKLPYYFISKGNALYLSDKGLERLINKNYGVILPNKKLPFDDLPITLYYNSGNNIWMTNEKNTTGWFKYETGNYKAFSAFPETIKALGFFTDNENNTWICTNGDGVYFAGAPFFSGTYLTKETGLASDHISCLFTSEDSTTWIGFDNGEKGRITTKGIEYVKFDYQDKWPAIQFFEDDISNVWAFTSHYLLLYKRFASGIYSRPERLVPAKLPGEEIISCHVAREGVLFAGTTFIGALKKSSTGYKSSMTSVRNLQNNISFVTRNDTGEILVAANHTLNVFRNDSLISIISDKNLYAPVSAISFITEKKFLVTTKGQGILLFSDGKRIRQLNTFQGQDLSMVNNLHEYDGIYYAATQQGLARFLVGDNDFQSVEIFLTEDGILSDQVSDVTITTNKILVSGSKGISILNLGIHKQYVDPPSLYISSIEHNNKAIEEFDSLQFNYHNLTLRFNFVAPAFENPSHVTYQYKITGLNENWRTTSLNFVELSAIEPGSYIFQLRAKKSNSDWSKPVVIKFEIIAPFYYTLLFRLLVANTLIFLLYIFLRDLVGRKFRRQLAVYERQQMLEQERNRISKDMHDDLGADLTNIVILSKITRKTIKPQSHELDAIDKIETAANDVINKMNEIIWALNPSNDSLYNLVSYMHRYSKEYLDLYKTEFSVSIPEVIPKVTVKAAYRRNIFLVVKEMLHNIVKHASASKVSIEISINTLASLLTVIISDNGKGFSVEEKTGSGNGLLNVQKRMKEIGGQIIIVSEPGEGTRVTLSAPFNK